MNKILSNSNDSDFNTMLDEQRSKQSYGVGAGGETSNYNSEEEYGGGESPSATVMAEHLEEMKQQGLGGFMYWFIGADDSSNTLLKAINDW